MNESNQPMAFSTVSGDHGAVLIDMDGMNQEDRESGGHVPGTAKNVSIMT